MDVRTREIERSMEELFPDFLVTGQCMKLSTGEGDIVEVPFVEVRENVEDDFLGDHGMEVAVGISCSSENFPRGFMINSSSFLW